MNKIDFLKTRRSNRNFKNIDISDNIINDILETGVQAPSSKNKQNWYFVVLRNRKLNVKYL